MARAWVAVLPFFLAACSDDVSVYRIPKEVPESPRAPEEGSSAQASKELRWTVPSRWTKLPASGMRLASFSAPAAGGSAEVSVVSLPGDAGGDLANVNRWRGQLGLPPLDEPALSAQARRLSSPAGELLVVDLAGQSGGKPSRMLAARLFASGQSWFFKMTGEESVVASAKASFDEFLGSLRLEAE